MRWSIQLIALYAGVLEVFLAFLEFFGIFFEYVAHSYRESDPILEPSTSPPEIFDILEPNHTGSRPPNRGFCVLGVNLTIRKMHYYVSKQ